MAVCSLSLSHASSSLGDMRRLWIAALAVQGVAGAQSPSGPTTIPTDSGMNDRRFPPTFQAIKLPTHGTMVNAVFYGAQGPELKPAIVFLHGFPGNERNLDLAQSLRRAGFHVLFFNYRGSWASGGAFSFAAAREDIGAAADDPTIRCTIALMPWNLGRVGALLSDPKADSRRFVASFRTNTDSISGPLRGTSSDALVREVVASKTSWDFAAFAPSLADRATLVVTSSRDETAPEFQRAGLDSAMAKLGARRYRSLAIDDDHTFSAHRLNVAKFVIDWIQTACERGE